MKARKRTNDVIHLEDSGDEKRVIKGRYERGEFDPPTAKRLRNADSEEMVEDVLNRRTLFDEIAADPCSTYDLQRSLYESAEKKIKKFDSLAKEAQQQCIRTVSRLFLFRGTKKEIISRTQLMDCLGKIETEYRNHCDVVLEKAQELLLSSTGYLIIDSSNIKGWKAGGKGEYYLVNTLSSNKNLSKILTSLWAESGQGTANGDRVGALDAFSFVIYHSIFNSPGYSIKCKDLLRNLRKVDSRFPENLVKSTSVSAPIKELEEDFLSLLGRLKKEHYLEITKDKQDPDDLSKQTVAFGARFYLEIGKKTLLKSYFAILGQPVDQRSFHELEMEENEDNPTG